MAVPRGEAVYGVCRICYKVVRAPVGRSSTGTMMIVANAERE